MKIFTSDRFLKYYYKGSPVVQGAAEGAIHDFFRGFRADKRTFLRRYARVAGIRRRVIEIDTGGSGRLLAHFANRRLTLLALGGKRIVPFYNDSQLDRDLKAPAGAPKQFWPENPSSFFAEVPDKAIRPYGPEFHPEWVYWLDEEQASIVEKIQEDDLALSALFGDTVGRVFFVVGGPGTGKSCVLLNLFKFYLDEGFHPHLEISRQLAEYISQSTGAYTGENWHYARDHMAFGESAGSSVLLSDDPSDVWKIHHYAKRAREGKLQIVVLAFDPLQLENSLTDRMFEDLVAEYRSEVYWLTTCYRQKENVGRATKEAVDTIAASTPFLADQKIADYRQERVELTRLSNKMAFPNPRGYTKILENPSYENVRNQIGRINKKGLLWRHWHPLLVVQPNDASLPASWYDQLNRVDAKFVPLDEVMSIKGLEFQHVFWFIRRVLFEQIREGFKGSGQSKYDETRLMRIPCSRAKDSLVMFVIEG